MIFLLKNYRSNAMNTENRAILVKSCIVNSLLIFFNILGYKK